MKIDIQTTQPQTLTSAQADAFVKAHLGLRTTLSEPASVNTNPPFPLEDITGKPEGKPLTGTSIQMTDGIYTDTRSKLLSAMPEGATIQGTQYQRVLDEEVLKVLLANFSHELTDRFKVSELNAVTDFPISVANLIAGVCNGEVNFDPWIDAFGITSLPSFYNLGSQCPNVTRVIYTGGKLAHGFSYSRSSNITYIRFKGIVNVGIQNSTLGSQCLGKLVECDISGSTINTMKLMFYGSIALTTLVMNDVTIVNGCDWTDAFTSCSKLTTIYAYNLTDTDYQNLYAAKPSQAKIIIDEDGTEYTPNE